MLIGVLILALVGILLAAFGYLIWKKENISLLHDYHYENVSDEDKPAFCALSGIGVLVIGAGLLASAVILALTDSVWSFAACIPSFIAGIAMLIYAGKKYN